MQVTKVGENLAVLLPETLVHALDLKEGDEIDLDIRNATGNSVPVADAKTREAAMERIRDGRRSLPSGYKFDREEANAR